MKKQKLLGSKMQPNCDYCRHGSDFDGAAVCKFGRYINPDGTCRRFEYDPLKREPKILPPLQEYDPGEFRL